MEGNDRIYAGDPNVKEQFRRTWREEIMIHEPPPILIFVVGGNENDEFHTRYLITANKGLGLDASINGWGNQDFTITVLSALDAENIEKNYIQPRQDVSARFTHEAKISVQVFTLAD